MSKSQLYQIGHFERHQAEKHQASEQSQPLLVCHCPTASQLERVCVSSQALGGCTVQADLPLAGKGLVPTGKYWSEL